MRRYGGVLERMRGCLGAPLEHTQRPAREPLLAGLIRIHPHTPRKDYEVIALSPRRLLATVLAAVGLLVALAMMNDISSARAATLNLETLTASEAEKMLETGELT